MGTSRSDALLTATQIAKLGAELNPPPKAGATTPAATPTALRLQWEAGQGKCEPTKLDLEPDRPSFEICIDYMDRRFLRAIVLLDAVFEQKRFHHR